uniref:Aminotransferase class I/classII large domain-containing protein n=1 Tax=Guillardia theta TaxID=55529 RepID=A0A7S4NWA6_GUITH|mmetsp:Transcript_35054/g.109543  ORF Transcript_35054/g.109543 Transcript_35054/m.109543 type:complete len:546 (+) Transcript_35054:32-1669(+)
MAMRLMRLWLAMALVLMAEAGERCRDASLLSTRLPSSLRSSSSSRSLHLRRHRHLLFNVDPPKIAIPAAASCDTRGPHPVPQEDELSRSPSRRSIADLAASPSFSVGITSSSRAARAPAAVIDEISKRYLKPGVVNLAAGSSSWPPPPGCMEEATRLLQKGDPELHRYGDCEGLQALTEKLKQKLKRENNIEGKEVMVTAGANQAFVNVMLAVCDPGDYVVLFKPYYYSHRVAVELAGAKVIEVSCESNFEPDLAELRQVLKAAEANQQRVKMAVIVTPGNPSGALISSDTLNKLVEICASKKIWLVSDETYEYFTYDGAEHVSPTADDGVINIYSMSKAYGMAGWRIGYVAYPSHLTSAMLKVQDTILTMATVLAQKVALKALDYGRSWVRENVKSLIPIRSRIYEVLEPLNPFMSQGAFYFMIKIPSILDEIRMIDMFANDHGLLLTPGSAFGMDGYLRLAYGCITADRLDDVCDKLKLAVRNMIRIGLRCSFEHQCSNPLTSGREGTWGELDDERNLIERETMHIARQASRDGKELLFEEDT